MSQSKADYINVIGAGLAGSEAAYQIAKRGIPVILQNWFALTLSVEIA